MLYARGEPDSFGLYNGKQFISDYDYMDEAAIPFIICNGRLEDGEPGLTHYDIYLQMVDDGEYDDENDLYRAADDLRNELEMIDDYELGRLWLGYEDIPNMLSFWGNGNSVDKRLIDEFLSSHDVDRNNTFVVCIENTNEETPVKPYNEWRGELTIMNDSMKNIYAIHLMNAKNKHNATGDFRKTRDAKIARKLTNDKGEEMPLAKYRSMIYSESRQLDEKIGGFNYANGGDHFYTQERDIVKELSNYDLSDKIIYCNCDNPEISNFYKFFKNNFSKFGLKGLYATYLSESPRLYFYDGSRTRSRMIKSGRFQDNARIMKKCDVVVTNPPFSNSMAPELINMARRLGKHVIMVGPNTIANQKEMFELIKNGQLNMGYSAIGRFNTPSGKKEPKPTSWWTTMAVNKPFFKTGVKYDPSKYQKYDNFDAIHIDDYRHMPDDYYGYMGVSPKVLRVLNRDQFDIIGKENLSLNGKGLYARYIIKRKDDVKENMDRKLIRLTESDLHNIIRNTVARILNEKKENSKKRKYTVYINGEKDDTFSKRNWKGKPKVGNGFYFGGAVFKIKKVTDDSVYAIEE